MTLCGTCHCEDMELNSENLNKSNYDMKIIFAMKNVTLWGMQRHETDVQKSYVQLWHENDAWN